MVEEDRRTALKTIGGTALAAAALAGCMGGGETTNGTATPKQESNAGDEATSTQTTSTQTPSTPTKTEGQSVDRDYEIKKILENLPSGENSSNTEVHVNPNGYTVLLNYRAPESFNETSGIPSRPPYGIIEGGIDRLEWMAEMGRMSSGQLKLNGKPQEIGENIGKPEHTKNQRNDGTSGRTTHQLEDGYWEGDILWELEEDGEMTDMYYAAILGTEEEARKNLEEQKKVSRGDSPSMLERGEYPELHAELLREDSDYDLPEEVQPKIGSTVLPSYVAQSEDARTVEDILTGGRICGWNGEESPTLGYGIVDGEEGEELKTVGADTVPTPTAIRW